MSGVCVVPPPPPDPPLEPAPPQPAKRAAAMNTSPSQATRSVLIIDLVTRLMSCPFEDMNIALFGFSGCAEGGVWPSVDPGERRDLECRLASDGIVGMEDQDVTFRTLQN